MNREQLHMDCEKEQMSYIELCMDDSDAECQVDDLHGSSVIMWAYDVENFYSPTASKIFNIINPH